jgi:hypothetical protein
MPSNHNYILFETHFYKSVTNSSNKLQRSVVDCVKQDASLFPIYTHTHTRAQTHTSTPSWSHGNSTASHAKTDIPARPSHFTDKGRGKRVIDRLPSVIPRDCKCSTVCGSETDTNITSVTVCYSFPLLFHGPLGHGDAATTVHKLVGGGFIIICVLTVYRQVALFVTPSTVSLFLCLARSV